MVFTDSHREAFDFASSQGFGDDELEAWRAFGPDADVPFTRALASGKAVWALTPRTWAPSRKPVRSAMQAGPPFR